MSATGRIVIGMTRSRLNEETRRKLLDEGVAVLIKQGYHGTGIKQVLDAVGVPKGSFYNYFESKEDFGVEVIRHFSGRFIGSLNKVLADCDRDALGALKRFFQDEIRACENSECHQGCLLGNLGAEIGARSELCRRAMAESLDAAQKAIEQVLAYAQNQGAVRKDQSAVDLAAIVLNAWEGSLIRMKVEGSTEPLRTFCSTVLDGLLVG